MISVSMIREKNDEKKRKNDDKKVKPLMTKKTSTCMAIASIGM